MKAGSASAADPVPYEGGKSMPSNLLSIDSNFPTFTGEEPVEQKLQELVNYIYQLRESLQYSLQNLSRENFNAAALDKLTEEASKEIVETLEKIWNSMTNLDAAIKGLQGRLTDAEKYQLSMGQWSMEQEALTADHGARIKQVEMDLSDLTMSAEQTEQKVSDMEADIGTLFGACIRSVEIVEVEKGEENT